MWVLTYLNTVSSQAKCQKKTVCTIAVLLLVIIPVFFLVSLVFVFISSDYGATNILEYVSVGYRFVIIAFYLIIGYLLSN